MALRMAINGFGRIGRAAFKIASERDDIDIVAVNDLADPTTLVQLLEHDSIFGAYQKNVSLEGTELVVEGKRTKLLAEKDPAHLPWKDLAVDVVLECTGKFADGQGAHTHIQAGAKRVIVSAPVKEGIPTYVRGVNDSLYKGEEIISNASCTTNCISPVAHVMVSKFGVSKALMTTIHAVTAEQNLVDGPPPGLKKGDMRRAREAYQNMVPTMTGAALATTEVVPELKGLFDGMAVRVPIADVSLTDFVFLVKKKTTVEEINAAFVEASQSSQYQGILGVTNEPLVSSDFIGSSYSAIVDLSLTKVIDGDLVKVIAWYDNEWGYATRLVEMAAHVGK